MNRRAVQGKKNLAAGYPGIAVEGRKVHRYGYDSLYRLTSVQYPNASSDSFTYDAVGNRLTKNSTTYSYDAADQMTVAGGVSYGYDANGNLTSRGSDTFTYDHQNRMTQAALAGGTYNYTYNGDGLRRTRSSSGSTHTTIGCLADKGSAPLNAR